MEELKQLARASDEPIDVLIVGSGAREHALLWKFARSERARNIFIAPGNGGTASHNIDIRADDMQGLAQFAKETGCLTVVGPDRPLELGIVDYFRQRGLPIFGPTREQARLEWSKMHAKQVMDMLDIPTARWRLFSVNDTKMAMHYARNRGGNVVVKAEGLADGKGVYVCSSVEESNEAITAMLVDKRFGKAGKTILIEDKLEGRELSVFALCNGIDAAYIGNAVDYKRLLDGDKGPNTGGMGAYSPVGWAGDNLISEIMKRMVIPTVRSRRFSGFLYLGLMITERGPMLIEYNARFGDPEAQAVMPRLNIDLLAEVNAIARGPSRMMQARSDMFNGSSSCCVVMSSEGYALENHGGEAREIEGACRNGAKPEALLFHAGTRVENGTILAEPGKRVLSVVGVDSDPSIARDKAYAAVDKISWENMHYRTDIGKPAVRIRA